MGQFSKINTIGEQYQKTNTENTSSNIWTTIVSQSLSAGTWLVIGTASFDSDDNGYRFMILTSNASDTNNNSINSVMGSGRCDLCKTRVFKFTSSGTVYINALQTSGSTLNAYGYLDIVRIC